MIKLLIIIIAMSAGLAIGPDLAGNQGYVIMSVANKTIEMSVTSFFVFIVLAFAFLFIIEFILRKLFTLSSSTRGWFASRRHKKAREFTNTGLVKMLEGDWRQAEKLMIKGANNSDAPLLNYLAAAEAAQGRGDVESRDYYLHQASEIEDGSLATAITRAKLQYTNGQYEEALAGIHGLIHANSRNTILLGLLKDCYIKVQDWQGLLGLLPDLQKAGIITQTQHDELEIKAERGLMKRIATQQGSDGLLAHWNGLSRHTKQKTVLVECLVEKLTEKKADNQAYVILRDQLKKENTDTLVKLIPKLSLNDYHPVIVKLEDLLRQDEENPVIQSALGQLYYRQKKWTEAKLHLEKALALRDDVTDYAWLAKTLEHLNDSQAADKVSRQALSVSLDKEVNN